MKEIRDVNIIVIGDSISKGLFLDHGEIKKVSSSFVDIFEKEYGVFVKNKSCFGQTLKRAVQKNVIANALSLFEKDKKNIVVISLGGNDADYDWSEVEKAPNISHLPKTPFEEFKQLLFETIKGFQDAGAKVFVNSIFPIDSKRYFENVISRKYDAQKVLEFLHNDITNLSRHQEVFASAVSSVAQNTGATFIDYRSKILVQNNFLNYVCDDGIHPNELGHKFIFEVIKQTIEKI